MLASTAAWLWICFQMSAEFEQQHRSQASPKIDAPSRREIQAVNQRLCGSCFETKVFRGGVE